uniref:BPM/SPOP BACK domain-containing protein n=1 Tax=Oryza barthii TaxID=65489 RepID=A0A0D3H037_9ORYZ
MEYVASPGMLAAVVATDGFRELKASCPSLLAEVAEATVDELFSSKPHATVSSHPAAAPSDAPPLPFPSGSKRGRGGEGTDTAVGLLPSHGRSH